MKLSPNQSLAGILEPVFAIRTEEDLGIGDTEGVRQMIDWCHRHRLSILQTLPINEISDDNSPYNALSSLAIEPATIAISPAPHPGPAAGADSRSWPRRSCWLSCASGPVNYPKVKALKRKLLEAAFENFLQRHFNRETERALQFRVVPDGERGLAVRLRAVPRADGGERRTRPPGTAGRREHRTPRTRAARGCCRCRRNAATS